ncbi:hypothetical protein D3C86_1430610 [compost metagenome]
MTGNVQLEGLHVDVDGIVQDRNNHRAAVLDDLLAVEARTYEGRFLRSTLVEAGKNQTHNYQRDEANAYDRANEKQIIQRHHSLVGFVCVEETLSRFICDQGNMRVFRDRIAGSATDADYVLNAMSVIHAGKSN